MQKDLINAKTSNVNLYTATFPENMIFSRGALRIAYECGTCKYKLYHTCIGNPYEVKLYYSIAIDCNLEYPKPIRVEIVELLVHD